MPRSVAFSNKQKKAQLKEKKDRKKVNATVSKYVEARDDEERTRLESRLPKDFESNLDGRNRYRLILKNEKSSDFKEKKKLQYLPLKYATEKDMEFCSDTFFPDVLDYPKRPPWTSYMSKTQLDQREEKYFKEFSMELDRKLGDMGYEAFYELNLETWRQLWRVTEMSDIVLFIVDARFVAAQFPSYIYNHLVEKENVSVILVMNKCDLIPPTLCIAWQDYLLQKFPKLNVVLLSSYEGTEAGKAKRKMAVSGALRVLNMCSKIMDKKVDLSSWKNVIECNANAEKDLIFDETFSKSFDSRKDVLTLGTVGYPNVGKSSLINALMGKKVVSVSKTPGHTKHFQTIFLTKNVKLCDCPGLVFPSVCTREQQILFGSFPISQVRDVVGSVRYIAERVDLPERLALQPLDVDEDANDNFEWTPFYVCEAWAKKRGYTLNTKGGRPDVFRAANELLRMTLIGLKSIILSLKPPQFNINKEKFELDPHLSDFDFQDVGKRCDPVSESEIDIDDTESEEETEDSSSCSE